MPPSGPAGRTMSDEAVLGPCQWCGEQGVTHVIVVPGRKNKRLAVVCESHAQDFESRGQLTTRLEVDRKIETERKNRQWKATRVWR